VDRSPGPVTAPSLGALFCSFARIGALSFGGGSTTLVLMHQELVQRHGWLTPRDFSFTLALSRMYPGVHLLAQAVLIGYQLRGLPGALICMSGMMLPSSAMTIVFTVLFLQLRTYTLGAAIIDSVLPATAGLALAVAFRLAHEELRRERGVYRVLSFVLAMSTFVLMAFLGVSSAIAVLLAGGVGALIYRSRGGTDDAA
jgi:chromate transporter